METAIKLCETSAEPLRRCVHSVYFPDNQKVPHGCTLCRFAAGEDCFSDITNPNRKTLRFVMPECGRPIYEQENEFRANQHSPGACPSCGCNMHFIEDDGRWSCADCREVWRGKAL